MRQGKHVNEMGHTYYYKDDNLHREDGPAVEFTNGSKRWFYNNMLHRLDGPAIDSSDGLKGYYIYDKCHREDGPAIDWGNGDREWWMDDEQISEEEFLERKFKSLLE